MQFELQYRVSRPSDIFNEKASLGGWPQNYTFEAETIELGKRVAEEQWKILAKQGAQFDGLFCSVEWQPNSKTSTPSASD